MSNSNVIGYWEAKEMNMSDDYGRNIKGSLALTKSELVFFRYTLLSGKAKEWRRILISGIKSIVRARLLNIITISYNRASPGSGGFRRFLGRRKISYKIKDWQTFIENIRKLNPNIKIKT